MSAGALFLAVFLACVVEAVEALTIVLAAGTSCDWRSAITGVVSGVVVLVVIVAVLGPALTLIPLAQRAADWYLARLPTDSVPYWDFDAPDIPHAPRDASAAAIAASGLVELGRLTGGERGAGYRRAAHDILSSLASSYLTLGTPNEAVLAHSVGFLRQNDEVDVGLVYADYYLLEAINRGDRQ